MDRDQRVLVSLDARTTRFLADRSPAHRVGMRYLIEAFAVVVLRLGAGIEQFLGPGEHDGEWGVGWVEIWPWAEGHVITLSGGVDRADGYQGQRNLYALSPFLFPIEDDEDMPFCQLGTATEPLEARELAEWQTGAIPSRWMNSALGMDEYADYVRAGSPSVWPVRWDQPCMYRSHQRRHKD